MFTTYQANRATKLSMFGYSKLFRSRWRALFWAAGILWFAVQVATPDEPEPAPDTNLQNVLQ